MPPWGRPSGGRKGKKRQQQREWEDARRFEEVDSESDDDQGVTLGYSFAGDELQFTGADLGRGSRNSRVYEYSDDSEGSDPGADLAVQSGVAMQLALRDKEDDLVARAMERIRRAQLLGKTKVKLTPPERDALQRKWQKEQAKAKRPTLKSKSSDVRRESGRSASSHSSIGPAAGRRKSRSSLNSRSDRETSSTGQVGAPGFVVPGPDGRPIYAPLGYYPPSPGSPYGPSSRPDSRTGSSHSLQQTPPLPQGQFRAPTKQRYSSVPEQYFQSSSSTRAPPSPRPMPDDPEWQPRPRSSSNLAYSPDPYQYQVYAPPFPQMPQQYTQGRRNVSGPAGVGYPTLRVGAPAAHAYAAASDPSLPRREYSGGSVNLEAISGDDYDEDDDEGVQVDVVPYGQSYDVNMSAAGPGTGRQRKSRR